MRRYVGLDAHSKNCVYVIQDEVGKVIGQGSVTTTLEGLLSLRDRYQLAPETKVALESGTMAFFVARRLSAMGLDPVVVDAHEVRAKAIRPNQKSDRRDALALCEGIRRGLYQTIVHVPSESIERLRESLARRRHFVCVKTMQVNAVKHLLRTAGLRGLGRGLTSERAWNRLLEAIEDPTLRTFCATHREVWRTAHEQVGALERLLEQQEKPHQEAIDRLKTVPGVGRIVALTTVAAFSDARRFPSAKHAASYAGLVASTYDSADRVQHGHITRRGSKELRAMLCEAAHHARLPNHPLNPYFTNLFWRRGYKMAVVAVAHRLCRILYAMLRDQADFDVNKLGVEEGRFEHTTVRSYRRKSSPLVTA